MPHVLVGKGGSDFDCTSCCEPTDQPTNRPTSDALAPTYSFFSPVSRP